MDGICFSNLQRAAIVTGLSAAVVCAVVYSLRDGQEGSGSVDGLQEGGQWTDLAREPSKGEPPVSGLDPHPSSGTLRIAGDLGVLCPDLWGEPGEACLEALDARFGVETNFAGLIDDPFGWSPQLAEVRARKSLVASLGGRPTWEGVFGNPSETRQAVAKALSRPECIVAEGQMRPRLRERCAADEMAKLALLHEGCVGALARDSAYREFGMGDVYAERWRLELADRAEEPDHDTYWRQVAEVEEERFRFAWRLHRCRSVPDEALAWIDAFPVPQESPETGVGYHQGGYLLDAAARLGNEWAAAWGMVASRKDMAALRRTDPALASLVEATDTPVFEQSPLEHLIVAVEWSHRTGKTWHEAALETLVEQYTTDDILEAIPKIAGRIPFEPVVVIDL